MTCDKRKAAILSGFYGEFAPLSEGPPPRPRGPARRDRAAPGHRAAPPRGCCSQDCARRLVIASGPPPQRGPAATPFIYQEFQ